MLRRLMVACIHYYQRHISPQMGSQCRFLPTCSQYAIEAIERYGPLKGGLMAVWRILRCNPFSRGGYDPVR
jgi:putative membrane protein insertion efficiency factor